MKILTYLQVQPEVRGAVLANSAGDVFDTRVGQVDDELVACMGFAGQQLRAAGENLGLGPVQSIVVKSAAQATLAGFQEGRILVASIDPSRPIGRVESSLHQHEWEADEPQPEEPAPLSADGRTVDELWVEPNTTRALPPPPPSRPPEIIANDSWNLPPAPEQSTPPARPRTDTQPWLGDNSRLPKRSNN